MNMYRFDWLAQRQEAPVDPERRIVDAHHHLWQRPGEDYVADDLAADVGAGHNVVATVFVECMAQYRSDGPEHLRPVGEVEFVAEQARRLAAASSTRIAGIVGFADLALGDGVAEVLTAQVEASEGLFRGIRHATAWDEEIGRSHTKPTPGLMGETSFRQGARVLAGMGLSFDAWLFHPQLPELVAFARDVPELTIISDHLGAPLGVAGYAHRRDEVDAAWRHGMTELATCPNVMLKLGGIGMERYFGMGWADHERPPSSDEVAGYWGDRIHWLIDTFGPARCLFESNYPVDREALPYPVLWNSLQKIASAYSDDEQDQLFSETATRVYRLEISPRDAR